MPLPPPGGGKPIPPGDGGKPMDRVTSRCLPATAASPSPAEEKPKAPADEAKP